MNVQIRTFTNPFSFFCITKDSKLHLEIDTKLNKAKTTELSHGQYVAVMWKSKWVRGIVTMENHLSIWLIDYGKYLEPNEKDVWVDLPLEYKKLPTKVFEASIHGILPTDKIWNFSLEPISTDVVKVHNDLTTKWTPGAIERAKALIEQSVKTYFKPVAVLLTPHNHVVLGDLFLKVPGKGIVNIVDELLQWPVFVEHKMEVYIKKLPTFYIGRRNHHACILKPETPEFDPPIITFKITASEYSAIVESAPALNTFLKEENVLDDSYSTVLGKEEKSFFIISAAHMEKYSKCFFTVNDVEYNMLSVMMNKARDLNMCERYKDYDVKYIGRATSRKPSKPC